MRPGALPSSGGGSHTWDFPNPFLYGGIFLVLATIAVSLVALACSHWRSSSSSSSSSSSNKDSSDSSSVKGQPPLLPLEMEPRIVIMAGDKEATFLAKPLYSSYRLYAQASPEPTNRPQV